MSSLFKNVINNIVKQILCVCVRKRKRGKAEVKTFLTFPLVI